MARPATHFLLAIILLLGCFANSAGADDRARLDEPFEITADRIDYEQARDLYVAQDHVRIIQTNRSLKARWVAFSTETRIGVAEGNVELLDGTDLLQADFMVFDVDTLQGMLFQGALDAGGRGFQVRAREMIRTGKNTFTLRDGVFSTCRCEPGERLPWQLRTNEAEVELGGYGRIKNSTFEVLGVPVLWIPWAMFPVKNDRETGLLLPDFAFGGRGGVEVGLPFFWAAHPQVNLTLTPRYFSEGGYKQDAEIEYVIGQESEGALFVAGLTNALGAKNGSFGRSRWAALWENDLWLPGGVRWQTDLNLASDNLYSDDFQEMRLFRTFRYVESTTNFSRDFGSTGSYGAMLGARYADDHEGSTFNDADEYLLQRFAEVRGDVLPGAAVGPLGLEARFDSELIHFSGLRTTESELDTFLVDPADTEAEVAARLIRKNARFYDIGFNRRFDRLPTDGGGAEIPLNGEGDGIFQPGEPLAERGSRIVLHPRLARPFRLGNILEFAPEIGWQQALYQSSAQKFAERGLITARAELRGRLARDYFPEDGAALRHVIEPRLSWAYVSRRRQRGNPLFVPRASVAQTRLRALSLENVTRNPSDRIEEANQLVLGVGQRFFVRPGPGRGPRLAGDLITAIDWDFADGGGLGDILVEGRLFGLGPVSGRLRGAFNPETVAVKEGEAEFNVQLPVPRWLANNARVGARYRYLRRLPLFFEIVRGDLSTQKVGNSELNQLDLSGRIELSSRIRVTYRSVYSLIDNEFIRQRGLVEYVSKCKCWGIGASVNLERRQGFGGGFEIRFLGLGEEKSNLFDGGFGAGLNL
ncbi:MAG: LPS-assembly protein LptD [Myxococcota bacterium]